jgi:hypothetical protein
MPETLLQFWFRNEVGRVFGPYRADDLPRLRGHLTRRWQASTDGSAYQPCATFQVLAPILAGSSVPPPTLARTDPGAPVQAAQVVQAAEAAKAAKAAEPAAGLAEMPLGGDLAATSAVRLYGIAAARGLTGRLGLIGESGRTIQLSLRRGTPEQVSSDDPEQSLVHFLLQRQAISGEACHAAEEEMRGRGCDAATALIQLRLLAPGDAHKVIGEQMLWLLDRALLTWKGTFGFEPDVAPPAGSFPLGQKWTLLAKAVRRLDPTLVRARFGRRLLMPVLRSAGLGIGRLEELALNAQESRLLATIDGTQTGEGLAQLHDPALALRILFLLSELGHLALSDAEPARGRQVTQPPVGPPVAPSWAPPVAPPPPKPAPGAASVSPPSRPGPGAPPLTTPRKLAPIITPHAGQPKVAPSPFPVAPPPPKIAPAAAKAVAPPGAQPVPQPVAPPIRPQSKPTPSAPPAVAAPRPALDPAGLPSQLIGQPGESSDQQAARLAPLVARLEKATHFEVLGLDRKAASGDVRRAFFQLARELHPDTVGDGHAELRALKQRLFARVNEASQVLGDGDQRKLYENELDGTGENVDISRIFAAEEAFQRASVLIRARKYPEGLQAIEEAISLHDQEAEFFAWRGWARFLVAKDRRAQHDQSAADCKKAIAGLPSCVAAWQFLGSMAKIVGDLKEAERCFKKVVELDPKHTEALRELRMMKSSVR